MQLLTILLIFAPQTYVRVESLLPCNSGAVVFQEVRSRLSARFSTRELSPLLGRNRAIYGMFGDEPGCKIIKATQRSVYRRPSFFGLRRKWMRRPRDASEEKEESVKAT